MNRIFAKISDVEAGYPVDSVLAKTLDASVYYEVESIDIGAWSTFVKLKGFDSSFNSVNLSFFKCISGMYCEIDIFTEL